jgi:hypothetical protein
MKQHIRRWWFLAGLVLAVALSASLVLFVRPTLPKGQFPASFSEDEKRQVVSAANSDAVRQTLKALSQGQFVEAKRWVINSRKQTVQAIGRQPEGKIWVQFGIPEPTATDGYATWARYIMKQENGRWVIDQPLF